MSEAAHRSILKGHYGKVGAMAAAAPAGCEISEIWDIWHEIVARSEGKKLSVQWVRTVRWRSSCGFSGEVGSDEMGFFPVTNRPFPGTICCRLQSVFLCFRCFLSVTRSDLNQRRSS